MAGRRGPGVARGAQPRDRPRRQLHRHRAAVRPRALRAARRQGRRRARRADRGRDARSRRRTGIGRRRDGIDPGEAFPGEHIRKCTERRLQNLRRWTPSTCMQFHVWNDEWVGRGDWLETIQALRDEGKIRFFGVSINDHQPDNAHRADRDRRRRHRAGDLQRLRAGARGRSCSPPASEHDVGVIARVPLDEGGLTGRITAGHHVPRRRLPQRLLQRRPPVEHVDQHVRGDPRRPRHRAATSCPRSRCATCSAAPRSRPSSPACGPSATWTATPRSATAQGLPEERVAGPQGPPLGRGLARA